jgi:hypothetical protein
MRRTIFLALFAALLFAPAARASTDPIEIQRDCVDDGVLQGNYSASDLRKARSSLPTDADEYSDCRDVLSRALAAKTSASSNDSNDSNGSSAGATSGGDSGGSGTSGGSDSPAPDATAEPAHETGPDSGTELPTTPQEQKAVDEAALERSVLVNGKPVAPAAGTLAADVGRNGLPGSMIAALALIAAAALSALVPFVRRRGFGHRRT